MQVVAHTFNHSTGGRGRQISESEASLVYRANSRTARAAQRSPVSKNKPDWSLLGNEREAHCTPLKLHVEVLKLCSTYIKNNTILPII